jgi:hypothetical protein
MFWWGIDLDSGEEHEAARGELCAQTKAKSEAEATIKYTSLLHLCYTS